MAVTGRVAAGVAKRDNDSMSSIALPSLTCPFPTAISPLHDELRQRSEDWAPGNGVVPGQDGLRWLRSARFGTLAASLCPEFDRDRLTDVVDWLVWLFAFDDKYCEHAGHLAGVRSMTDTLTRFLRVMSGGAEPSDDAFEQALVDIWQRTAERATPIQLERLHGAFSTYFFSLIWEANHSASTVTLADYVFMRPETAGVTPWLLLVEIIGGTRPDPEVMAGPEMRTLHEHAAHVINWMNDIVSFQREAAVDADALNLVIVIGAERGLDPQKALDLAAAMHAEEVGRYQRAESVVLVGASEPVRAYVRSLGFVISGFYTWFMGSGRYAGA